LRRGWDKALGCGLREAIAWVSSNPIQLHHAWIDHGIELCRIAFILIDAKDPL
jgi:hypothetical protein